MRKLENIPLQTLELVTFDKNNPEHLVFLKDLIHDKSILKWFQNLTAGLLHPQNHVFFNRSFLVAKEGTLVGFVNIGAYNEQEKSVYLRAAISQKERKKGYGKALLSEITDYIFNNYLEVESVRLKINSKNIASLNNARSCHYKWLIDDFYTAYNPNLMINDEIIKK